MTADLTLVELFAGIGGFSCGFDRAGVRTVAAVEIDPAARRVFARHFPDAVLFNDVTEVSGDDLRAVGFVPERGIITAGFPCQDLSIAGRGKGLAGSRSGLFTEIVRLLTELCPRWFVLENVPRLLSINGGRDMGTVVTALAECGYGLAWRVLDASGFGVPQQRRRVFLVGHFGDTGQRAGKVLFEPEGLSGDSAEGGQAGPQVAGKTSACAGNCCRGLNLVGPQPRRGIPSADEVAGGQLVVEHRADISSDTHTHTHLNASGRRQEGLPNRRGSRSRGASDRVAALTANGVGTCGADDNQAQAGHLIAQRHFHSPLREIDEQHSG